MTNKVILSKCLSKKVNIEFSFNKNFIALPSILWYKLRNKQSINNYFTLLLFCFEFEICIKKDKNGK